MLPLGLLQIFWRVVNGVIAIGAAFYARQFNDVPNTDHGLHQPGHFERFLSMKQLQQSYNEPEGYASFWDDEAQAPYRYNAPLS